MEVKDVKKIAVFVAGTMGPSLALVFTVAGHEVMLYSRKAETLEKALLSVRASLDTLVQHGTLGAAAADAAMARMKSTQSVSEAAEDADFGERSQCPFLSCNEFSECAPSECYANIALRWALKMPMPEGIEGANDEKPSP